MLAWGKKVPQEFRNRVREVARTLGTDVNHLMACMALSLVKRSARQSEMQPVAVR